MKSIITTLLILMSTTMQANAHQNDSEFQCKNSDGISFSMISSWNAEGLCWDSYLLFGETRVNQKGECKNGSGSPWAFTSENGTKIALSDNNLGNMYMNKKLSLVNCTRYNQRVIME